MALVLYILKKSHWVPECRMSAGQKSGRKRLRKAQKSLYSCKDVVRENSCLVIFSGRGSGTTIEQDSQRSATSICEGKLQLHMDYPLQVKRSNSSQDTTSIYSNVTEEEQLRKRIRPKTPVFAVGQLERNSTIRSIDKAQCLAAEYQAVIPPRAITPYIDQNPPTRKQKKLRKIKCQLSLRGLVKNTVESSPIMINSDTETLVGSEPPSPIFRSSKNHTSSLVKAREATHMIKSDRPKSELSALDDDIGLKICMDLLTAELATKLFKRHPAESSDRASGLQILLMIEAYETVQQQVRQRLYDLHVRGQIDDHMRDCELILEYWLHILYSIYDHSQEIKNKGGEILEDGSPLWDPPEASQIPRHDGYSLQTSEGLDLSSAWS